MASDMKRAVQELRALRQQLDEMERTAREPIAVIGMAGRFPGADTLEAFWALLREGHDAITEIPSDRWNVDAYYDPDPAAAGKAYVRRGGFGGHRPPSVRRAVAGRAAHGPTTLARRLTPPPEVESFRP